MALVALNRTSQFNLRSFANRYLTGPIWLNLHAPGFHRKPTVLTSAAINEPAGRRARIRVPPPFSILRTRQLFRARHEYLLGQVDATLGGQLLDAIE